MNSRDQVTVLRYWGSHFKHPRHPHVFLQEFRPLIARGWRCCLVLERRPEDPHWLRELTDLGIQIECASRPRGNFDWQCVLRVRALCRRLQATVFHCDNLHTSPLIGAWLARVPVRVWSKRSMNSDYEECRPPTFKERLGISTRLSCCLTTRTIAVSTAVKDELVGLGVPEPKVMVRSNPRRLGNSSSCVDRSLIRKTWGCSPSDVVIVNVGHAVPVKGWDILLAAFATVAKSNPRARLVLIGSYEAAAEQSFYSQLRAFIDSQGLNGRVLFAGHAFDIRSVLKAAELFVMPSRSEGFSLALIEALEAGLPCVASRVGVAAEVIQSGVNGLLVERNDPADLSSALVRVVQDDRLRSDMTRRASLPPWIPTLEEYAEQIARDYAVLLRENGFGVQGLGMSCSDSDGLAPSKLPLKA